MQSAAAVALVPLLIFWLRTPQQRLAILFDGPNNRQKLPLSLGIWTPSDTLFLEQT